MSARQPAMPAFLFAAAFLLLCSNVDLANAAEVVHICDAQAIKPTMPSEPLNTDVKIALELLQPLVSYHLWLGHCQRYEEAIQYDLEIERWMKDLQTERPASVFLFPECRALYKKLQMRSVCFLDLQGLSRAIGGARPHDGIMAIIATDPKRPTLAFFRDSRRIEADLLSVQIIDGKSLTIRSQVTTRVHELYFPLLLSQSP